MENLILTFDYELFGDGSGDVFRHMIEPTEKILHLCEQYGIRVTIFFEALEFIKLKEEWDRGNKMGYSVNPVGAIEKQIQGAILSGHDIQLHVHPQWIKARYTDGSWQVDNTNWSLGTFSSSEGETIKDVLLAGKRAVEAIVNPVMPQYKCKILRAGYYNIMPSTEIFSAMQELGLKADSSVYPGGFENSMVQKYDFRSVSPESGRWWAAADDIRVGSEAEEILELPVFALPVPVWRRLLTKSRIRSLLLRKARPLSSGAMEKLGSKTLVQKLLYLVKREATPWDVCMFPESLNKKYFRYVEKRLAGIRSTFVLIGHPKSLSDERVFASFLRIAFNRKKSYTFMSLDEQYGKIV